MKTNKEGIVAGYARMWPREVFAGAVGADALSFLDGPGVYILYRDDMPYYIGQGTILRNRLWGHARRAGGRYYHFWNLFSAFAVNDQRHGDELEGILIAAMPTANSARPRLRKERMPRYVRNLLHGIYGHRLPIPAKN